MPRRIRAPTAACAPTESLSSCDGRMEEEDDLHRDEENGARGTVIERRHAVEAHRARDAERRAIRFHVRIGSFGADIVYPGKLTADRGRECLRRRRRDVSRARARAREGETIDRVTSQLFLDAIYHPGRRRRRALAYAINRIIPFRLYVYRGRVLREIISIATRASLRDSIRLDRAISASQCLRV